MSRYKVKNGKVWAIEFNGKNCAEITIFSAGRVIRSTLPKDEEGNRTMIYPSATMKNPPLSIVKGWWVMRDEEGHVLTLSGPPE